MWLDYIRLIQSIIKKFNRPNSYKEGYAVNRIYKTICNALTGQTTATSELAKGRGKSQSTFATTNAGHSCLSMLDVHQHHTHRMLQTTNHVATRLHIALSALFFTVWGSSAFAQQLIYDSTGAPSTAPLKTANNVIFGATGLPTWLNVNAADQGVIYLDNNGAGSTVTTGANLVINYTTTGIVPQFVIGGYSHLGGVVKENTVTLRQGNVNGPVVGGLSFLSEVKDDVTTPSIGGSTIATAGASLNGFSANSEQNTVVISASLSPSPVNVYGGLATIWAQAGQASAGNASGTTSIATNAVTDAFVSNVNLTARGNSVIIGQNASAMGNFYSGLAQVWAQSANATSGNGSAIGNAFTCALSNVSVSNANIAANNNTVVAGQNSFAIGNLYGGSAQLIAQAAQAKAGNGTGSASSAFAYANANTSVSNVEVIANGNTVKIEQDSSVTGNLYAGYAQLSVTGGHAIGGTGNGVPANASATVNVSDVKVFADNNEITFNGTLQNGSIYGGYVQFDITQGTATKSDGTPGDTSVTLTGTQAQTINNIVTIGDNARFNNTGTSLYGGYLQYNTGFAPQTYDVFTGNTLNWSAKAPATFQSIANFEHYNFTLNPAYANTNTALINAQDIILGTNSSNISDGNTTPSKIAVAGIHSGNVLKAGDEFILMQASNSMTGDGTGGTTNNITQAQQGISLLYDVQTTVDMGSKQARATILVCRTGAGGICVANGAARVNPRLKAFSEGYLAGSQLVMRGADMAADDAFRAINEQNNQNGWMPFAIMSAQHNRYNSGSHIKSNDFLLTGGLSYQQNNLTAGAFVEGGWGSYDTYNSFYNAASVKGDGHDRYYGLGLLGRYDFESGLYADASLRFGRNRNKFDTNDIQNIATGEYASYTVSSNYVSAHIGIGYIMQLNGKNQLDISAKYLYSTLGGKDAVIAGDSINFERINSHRVRLNATLNHQYSPTLTFNTGVGYEHEFDSKARATTYGIYSIDAPSVRGGTGIVSVGANIKPAANQRLTLDIKANGYTGKREGVGASIRVNYAF